MRCWGFVDGMKNKPPDLSFKMLTLSFHLTHNHGELWIQGCVSSLRISSPVCWNIELSDARCSLWSYVWLKTWIKDINHHTVGGYKELFRHSHVCQPGFYSVLMFCSFLSCSLIPERDDGWDPTFKWLRFSNSIMLLLFVKKRRKKKGVNLVYPFMRVLLWDVLSVTASIVTCNLWSHIYCTVGVFICALWVSICNVFY